MIEFSETIKMIDIEIKELEELSETIKKDISKSRKGAIRCNIKGNKIQYYEGKKYLRLSEEKHIKEIVNHDYEEKLIVLAEDKIKHLKRLKMMLEYDYEKPDNLYDGLHPGRQKYVEPLLISKTKYVMGWENTEYDRWPISDDDVRGNFVTIKGERVRSKSEKIIADEFTRYGIPYRYEYPLKLVDNGRTVIKRPDFLVLNKRTLGEYVVEHLGMLDNSNYFANNIEKISLYEKNNYLLGKNLLIFHETSFNAIDTQIIGNYIEEYLL